MSDAYVQVAADSTGKKIQTFQNSVSGQTVQSQAVVLVDSSGVPIPRVKVFEARILQSGIDAPVFDVIYRNELGLIPVLYYVDVGIYSIDPGPSYSFTEWLMIEIGNGQNYPSPVSDWVANLVGIQKITGIPNDTFNIVTFASSLNGNWVLSDDILFDTPIRLTAYPH